MTNKNTPTNAIEAAQQEAANARAAAHAAQERAANLAAEAHANAAEQRTAAWQEYLDNYDPKARREAVIEAEAAFVEAFKSSTFGAAFANYVKAIHIERTAHILARDARTNGAIPNESVTRFIEKEAKYVDAQGIQATQFGYLSDFPTGVLAQTVHEIAISSAQQLDEETREAVSTAFDSANAPTINAYKIIRPGFNGTEFDGLDTATFIDGVTYIPANSPKLPYFQKSSAYTVEPAFSIPEDWSDLERAFTTTPSGSGFIAKK